MFNDDEPDLRLPDVERGLRPLALQLARAALAGPLDTAALRVRFERVLGRRWPWITALIRKVRLDYGDDIPPESHDELVSAMLCFAPLRAACEADGERPVLRGWYPFLPPMGVPPRALADCAVPALATPGDIADWLGLNARELDWFCAARRVDPDAGEALHHYRYRWLAKRRGGQRLIEMPKPRLRAMQRRILAEILERVPLHPAAHGGVRGRSALSAATPHAGQDIVLQIDLQDFFATIHIGRVQALFRTLGYPAAAARVLARLVTHATPHGVLRAAPVDDYASPEERRDAQRRLAPLSARHLPQGAPSSPALANLCTYRLDLRLAAAAAACGAAYSRYVDDLVFSGDAAFARGRRRFETMAYSIIIDEGFAPNFRKTRAQPRSGAQRLLGMVVNRHPNIARSEYELLKAILHNCAAHGPETQNRHAHPAFRDHLLGRIARVAQLNPRRGARLTASFRYIDWDGAPALPAQP